MDVLDAITSLFSSPSRGRDRTRQEENALGLAVVIGPRLGLHAARSLRLGLGSACVCASLNALTLFPSQPLF